MSPALGDAGKLSVLAPPVLFIKYPVPLVAVVGVAVTGVVFQSTVPVLPNPV